MMKLRAAALCGAGMCAAAARETAQLDGGPRRTLLTLVAFVGLVLLAAALTILAVSPQVFWTRITDRLVQLHASLIAAPILEARRVGIALIVVALATYVVLASIYIPRQIPPKDNDQDAYLDLARDIREQGGVVGCLRDLFTGRFAEANRHPLYPVLLSFAPTYEGGKSLSTVLGGITLLTLAIAISHKFNALVAGLFSVFVATNAAFLFVSTLVACEILVIWCCGLIWLMTLPDDQVPQPSVPELKTAGTTEGKKPSGLAWSIILGALFGILYLVKAHAVLLIAGLVLWLPLRFRAHFVQPRKWLAAGILFLIGFGIVASPLLVRNVVRFGQPFFNVNGHLLFEDQYVDPGELAARKTTGQAAKDYWRTHSIKQIVSREVKGLAWETFIIVRSFGPAPWDDGRVTFGGVIALACLIGIGVEPGGKTDLLIPWAMLLWVFFAWYVPIAAGERFILPILTPVLTYAALGMLLLIRRFRPNDSPARLASRIVAASVVWCAATVLLTYFYLEFEIPG